MAGSFLVFALLIKLSDRSVPGHTQVWSCPTLKVSMQAEPLLKQNLSFWEADAAAELLHDVPQGPHAEGDSPSSDSGSESSLDLGEWAAALWELHKSEEEMTADENAAVKVGPATFYTMQQRS